LNKFVDVNEIVCGFFGFRKLITKSSLGEANGERLHIYVLTRVAASVSVGFEAIYFLKSAAASVGIEGERNRRNGLAKNVTTHTIFLLQLDLVTHLSVDIPSSKA
jgi:hypothetical protein